MPMKPLSGDRLRAARERGGWSLRQLAERAGLSHQHIADVENGRRNFSPELEQRVRRALRKEGA